MAPCGGGSCQTVEAYDGYYGEVRAIHQWALDELVGGQRHIFEAEMKELRRTRGREGHEAAPDDADGEL